MLSQHFKNYLQLMRWDKPIGFWLLLWPTLMALFLAHKSFPPLNELFLFILGTWLTRSAGCVINDIADRKIDIHVDRTYNRPLAQKRISLTGALVLLFILAVLALIIVLMLPPLCFYLALIAACLITFYPFSKRFFILPQLILGITFAFGVPIAYFAVQQKLPAQAWYLYILTVVWILAYDTLYALVDKEEDKKLGIYSSALTWDAYASLYALILLFIYLFGMLFIGIQFDLSKFYYGAWLLAFIVGIYQIMLVYRNTKSSIFKAFKMNGWLGFFIFSGIMMGLIK